VHPAHYQTGATDANGIGRSMMQHRSSPIVKYSSPLASIVVVVYCLTREVDNFTHDIKCYTNLDAEKVEKNVTQSQLFDLRNVPML
jgi:hypothetical protein